MGNFEEKNKIKSGGSYLITLKEASKVSGYTQEHLNLLCRKGILRGEKVGRNWKTTPDWLQEFLLSPGAKEGKIYKRRKLKKNAPASKAVSFSKLIPFKKEAEIFREKYEEAANAVEECFGEKNESGELEIGIGKKEKKSFFHCAFKMIGYFSAMFTISFSVFFAVSFSQYAKIKSGINEKNIPLEAQEDLFLVPSGTGIVRGEEDVNSEETAMLASSISKSENFALKQLSIGGVLVASANNENLGLEVYDVRSEVFASKDGKKAQLLLTWKTNKLAVSELGYSKNNFQDEKIIQESFYGFNHSALLPKLDLATTYAFRIKSKDKWANEITSNNFGVYSGSKMVSVFDLIFEAFGDTFKWAKGN